LESLHQLVDLVEAERRPNRSFRLTFQSSGNSYLTQPRPEFTFLPCPMRLPDGSSAYIINASSIVSTETNIKEYSLIML
jgi:hypothetical protein